MATLLVLCLTIQALVNRLFPSCLFPLCQNESKCKNIRMKMCSTYRFFFMQIKLVFIRMVLHLDSFWNRGTRELGNGLFSEPPTGVEPMTFQIPLRRSNHWAMGDSWWARWARSYTVRREQGHILVSSLFTFYSSHQSIYHLFTFIISTRWALQYGRTHVTHIRT